MGGNIKNAERKCLSTKGFVYSETIFQKPRWYKDIFRHTKGETVQLPAEMHHKKCKRKYFRHKENDTRWKRGSTFENE